MTDTRVKRQHDFAIFWGGGLGDILTLRPLLMALEATLDAPPRLFTTANHLPGLLQELGLRTRLTLLPKEPVAALQVFRELGVRFDWLYLGARWRIKTRMLAYAIRPRRIWDMRHPEVDPFIGEQVLADVRALGLARVPGCGSPYGGAWEVPPAARPPEGAYLVLHPGAKQGWQTKHWPHARWAALMDSILSTSDMQLLLVGTAPEREALQALASAQPEPSRARVQIRDDLTLSGLAAMLRGSHGVICHNSGVLHLAALQGKPTVSLTGSSPRYWRPPYAHVLNLDSGRCGLACGQYRCPVPFYRARCIRELEVDAVMQAVQQRLLG